jgi:hypothetical protein
VVGIRYPSQDGQKVPGLAFKFGVSMVLFEHIRGESAKVVLVKSSTLVRLLDFRVSLILCGAIERHANLLPIGTA